MKELFSSIVSEDAIRENEPMSAHTTFEIGGPCDLMVFPASIDELSQVVAVCRREKINFFVLGKGSNILVSDRGIRGVVIVTERIQHLEINGNMVDVTTGYSLINVSKATAELGLSGLEFACGIPGSIGGAVYMNAGAYDGEMKNVIESVTVLDAEGVIREIPAADMALSYRHSRLKDEPMVCLSVRLRLAYGDKKDILTKIADLSERRSSRQPLELPSSGSTFKRPTGYYAGPLIIDAGLQGYQIGGAQVSTKHAGFVVNVDHATADDVIRLIHHVQKTVKTHAGVDMETEVRFIGDWEYHPLYHEILCAE